MKSPEVIAEDILSSFSENDIDKVIDMLVQGRKCNSMDCVSQEYFSWMEGEMGEEWNQTTKIINGKTN